MEVNEPIKNFEILLAKDNVDEEIESIEATKEKQIKSRIRMQAGFNYTRRI